MKSVKCYRFSVNQPADVNWWSALGESAAYLISSVFLGSEIVDVVDVVDVVVFVGVGLVVQQVRMCLERAEGLAGGGSVGRDEFRLTFGGAEAEAEAEAEVEEGEEVAAVAAVGGVLEEVAKSFFRRTTATGGTSGSASV